MSGTANVHGMKRLFINGTEITELHIGGRRAWKRSYTNLLPTATDLDRVTIYGGVGYMEGKRLSSSSGGIVTATGMCASGVIPAKEGDILRITGVTLKSGTLSYVMAFDSANAKTGVLSVHASQLALLNTTGIVLDRVTFGTGFDAIRISFGTIDRNTIVTLNEEI